jgi:DNA protecting protein DprA
MNSSDAAILQLLLTRGVGPRTIERVLTAAAAAGQDLADLRRGPEESWVGLGLKPEQAQGVVAAREQAERLADELDARGVLLLTSGRAGYPSRLARAGEGKAPPVLFARGNRGLLDRPAVAFCGSRHASEAGLRWTEKAAARLAAEGVNVVSGYAAGVDLAAHVGALRAGGTTTLVLAEGILRFTGKPEIAEWIEEESRLLILSEFSPRLPWSAGNAMKRNGAVTALADAVVVVESGLEGGTFAAGEQALEEGRRLYVLDYPTPPPSAAGNRHFLNRGARPLPLDKEPDLGDLLTALGEGGPVPDRRAAPMHKPVQRLLFE